MKKLTNKARARILDTAVHLFYEQGYNSTGINQIIAESDVAKNTFYYYFPSKEQLGLAYLQEQHKKGLEEMKKIVYSFKSPQERIMGVFVYLEKWLKRCDFRGCPFVNVATEIPDSKHPFWEQIIKHKTDQKNFLADLIQDATKSPKNGSSTKRKEMADFFYTLFEGAIVASQNFRSVWPVAHSKLIFKKNILGNL